MEPTNKWPHHHHHRPHHHRERGRPFFLSVHLDFIFNILLVTFIITLVFMTCLKVSDTFPSRQPTNEMTSETRGVRWRDACFFIEGHFSRTFSSIIDNENFFVFIIVHRRVTQSMKGSRRNIYFDGHREQRRQIGAINVRRGKWSSWEPHL